MKLTRREIVMGAGLLPAAFLSSEMMTAQAEQGNSSSKGAVPFDFSKPPVKVAGENCGWKYVSIDPRKTADDAYHLFAEGACHYASFRAIITNVARALPAEDSALAQYYLSFPFYMMVYGQAGLAYYGSLCGALNGCGAALSLFVPRVADKFAMIQELAVFYETASLPVYIPQEDKYLNDMPANVSGSILCHVSLDRWMKNSGRKLEGPWRVERCNRLTCDVVMKTVELLNRYHSASKMELEKGGMFAPLLPETQSCLQCHSDEGTRKDSLGKMNCTDCHPVPASDRKCPRRYQ